MDPAIAQSLARFIALCACPTFEGEQASYLHDWERWNRAESEENTSLHKCAKMTTLQAYAAHSAVTYGKISAKRFGEIVRGDEPTQSETISVCQGFDRHACRVHKPEQSG